MSRWILVILCFLTSLASAQSNLLPGGDFEKADDAGFADGWNRVKGTDVQRREESGNHFARLTVAKSGESAVMQRELKLEPSMQALQLSLRVRYTDIKRGAKGWNDGRAILNFTDAAGKAVGNNSLVINWTGTAKDWASASQACRVPTGAVKVKVQIALFSVTKGVLDIDDVVLSPVDAATVPAKDAPADDKASAPQTASAAPTSQPLPYRALESNFTNTQIEGKMVAGWSIMAGAPKIETEKDVTFLRLEADAANKTVQVRRYIPLNSEWGKLKIDVKVRPKGVRHGERGWQNARLIAEFMDASGKRMSVPSEVLNWNGSSKKGWLDESIEYVIPMGAARLKLDPALLQVEGGILDLASLNVTILENRSAMVKGDLLPESWKPGLIPHYREKTATRERICLNGVWQIRPIGLAPTDPKQITVGLIQNPPFPIAMQAGLDWGYTKLPSNFPGSKESAHELITPEAWTSVPWADTDAVWYRRTIEIPADWSDKRITLDLDTVQSQAAVFIGEKLVGRVNYPAGEIDLTNDVKPGESAQVTIFVVAKPFQEARVQAMNPNELYLESAELKHRGLCGDLFLSATPKGARLENVQLRPSVRQKQLGLKLRTLEAAGQSVRTRVVAKFKDAIETEWTSEPHTVAADGTLTVAMPWLAKNLWDIDAPNLYDVTVALLDDKNQVLDERRERLGFREIWLDGRDIILNGSPIHWMTTKIGNTFPQRSKALMAGTFKRMRELGFNCMILDYDVIPGSAPSYQPMLEAADEVGVVITFTIPCLLPWKGESPDAAARASWEKLTRYCIDVAQNHPSVLAYSTNHNRLGYAGSLNPEKIDGLHVPNSPDPAFAEKRKIAMEAEHFIRSVDPTREVYHHSAGNFGSWENANIYLNWMPIQERMEYLSHWSEKGVKPLFITEFGMPFVASWGRFRGPGVPRPQTENEPLFIEYSAAMTGTRAYELNSTHESYVDAYEGAFQKTGKTGWAVLTNPWMRRSVEWNYVEIQARIARDTFPAMRTQGISGLLPWDWKSVANWTTKTPQKVVLTGPAEDWTKPGLHPDYTPGFGYSYDETWFSSPAADTFATTSLAEAFKKVNADVLAWIAGKPEKFTEQTHLFWAGQKVVKQVIVINDLRRECKGSYIATVKIGDRTIGEFKGAVAIAPGKQQRDRIEFTIPTDAHGEGKISLSFDRGDGVKSEDEFAFSIVPPTPAVTEWKGVAIFDPKGDTTAALKAIGVTVPAVQSTIPNDTKCLLIGREALTLEGATPDIRPLLARGGRVVLFEQTNAVLTQRLGFRTNVISPRNVFVRTVGHALLEGLNDEYLRDWNGDATLIPSKLQGLPEFEAKYPAGDWLGFRNTRVWKVSNWGQVASVVIEKPQSGDFLPLIDCGFDLQYSPLMLTKQDGGEILFCQMDLSGRSESDPAANRLLANIAKWASADIARNSPATHFVGDESSLKFLQSLGAKLSTSELPAAPTNDATYVIANLSADKLKSALPVIRESKSTFVFLFQTPENLKAFDPYLTTASVKIVGDALGEAPLPPAFQGVGPAEIHLRSRTQIHSIATAQGWKSTNGSLAAIDFGSAKLVFVQIDPRVFDYTQPSRNFVKLTHNRTRTLVSRVLANAGVSFESPLIDYWSKPGSKAEIDLTAAKWEATVDAQNKLTPESAATDSTFKWQKVPVPGPIEDYKPFAPIAGRFWYRVKFDVPPALLESTTELFLGTVDDEDWTHLNGQQIGHIGKDTHPTSYYRQNRVYKIPTNLLKAKENVLVIQGNNIEGVSGILEGPARIAPLSRRWQASYYLDTPVALDDPYRYYRW